MKILNIIGIFICLNLISGCVTEFIPYVEEEKELLVVEGLITDKPVTNTIKLSKSRPLGELNDKKPLAGCSVSISDNLNNSYNLIEKDNGVYVTDSTRFTGMPGRTYTLHITTSSNGPTLHYESYPVEMKPVAVIDSVYYEKLEVAKPSGNYKGIDECQIYLDAHGLQNGSRHYRWEFEETWVLRLLYPVENMTCWISEYSGNINVRSTAALGVDRITRLPVTYISNETDRLSREYSILVKQYSVTEEEYNYWKKLEMLTENVGGLHDVIPSTIPSNLFCKENPSEKVLGYFSVSAFSEKRIFIRDTFAGIIDRYSDCPSDTVYGDGFIPGLGIDVWTIIDTRPSIPYPRIRVLTKRKGCADCTERGSNKMPDYWPSISK